VVSWAEYPAWFFVEKLVASEPELWEEEVGVWIVNGSASVAAEDFVFIVLVVSVTSIVWTVLRESVWLVFDVFIHEDEFGASPWLTWSAEVSPEAGFVHKVAPAVVEIAAWFGGDLVGTRCWGWVGSERVWLAIKWGVPTTSAAAVGEDEGGDDGK